jgi:excisionase family DNA binding protein
LKRTSLRTIDPPHDDDDLLLPHPEVTAILGRSYSWVYAEMRKRKLTYVMLGKNKRVKRADLREYIERNRVPSVD